MDIESLAWRERFILDDMSGGENLSDSDLKVLLIRLRAKVKPVTEAIENSGLSEAEIAQVRQEAQNRHHKAGVMRREFFNFRPDRPVKMVLNLHGVTVSMERWKR